ncbi:50S ribosome-binding GTPase, partial [Eubacteriales bacterium OttesenSCG-928-N13]|nr:50S ribosome-binding GTPase [Eubacteriales bacterium OttesenSCG-928-N13]
MTQIALIGNPNCGKTTLLNALTGAQLRVGNWPGVTVERKQAQLSLGDRAVMLNDLPGVYSLDAYSIEEKVALGYLQSGQPQLILNVVDATNLERNLYLTLQLQALGLPVVVALNLMDAFHAEGGRLDVSALS